MKKETKFAIEVKNFTKRYTKKDKPAVDNISFIVNAGEFHGFIGANGAGKTTTIKSLIGAYTKFSGKINFFGFKHNSLESKKAIGYVPENAIFPKGIKTITYLKWLGFLSGLSFKEAKQKSLEILKSQGLEDLANKKPTKFSSGQKKSILLTQALLHDPKILIMDEPAANLDPTARISFFNKLKELQEKGLTIFISSHILSELQKYVDALTILDGGKVVYSSKIEKTKSNNYFISIVGSKTKLKTILNSMKIKTKAYKNGFIIPVENNTLKNKILKELMKQKLEIENFNKSFDNLEIIYKQFVKVGSNHTSAIKKNRKVH